MKDFVDDTAIRSATLRIEQIDAIANCAAEPALFRELFGDSVEVSVEAIWEHRDRFDWRDARRLLDAESRAEYDPLLRQARIDYWRALTPFGKDRGPEFEAARTAARDAWDSTLAPAWAKLYVATQARAKGGAA